MVGSAPGCNICMDLKLRWKNGADFLEISRSAKQIDVDRAFRKRSRALHPDKARQALVSARASGKPDPNPIPGKSPKSSGGGGHVNKKPTEKEIKAAEKVASDRFTRLGLIAEILKDDRRKSYDRFLDHGFPKWRGTGYYYERFRPGLLSTLMGLFVFAGGVLHYVVLQLGYRRQKEFMERYIRQARQSAWGNTSSSSASAGQIPGLSDDALGGGGEVPAEEESPLAEAVNRRERRAQEKDSKKKHKEKTLKPGKVAVKGPPDEAGDSDPSAPASGARRRIQAENGKILVVDRVGSVFLEEEDGETEETRLLLLDPNEIEKPTFKQTFLYRLLVSVPQMAQDKISGGGKSVETEVVGADLGLSNGHSTDALSSASLAKSRKRKGRK